MSEMVRDAIGVKMQLFAPARIVSVTTATWTPTAGDKAFRVSVGCTYQIDGAGEAATLQDGAITGIQDGFTYKFDTAQNIEVM